MSNSETAAVPSEATISSALANVVIAIHKSGNTDDLTVKRVRTKAEAELGLPGGFLKKQEWKQKSHDLIHEAVDRYCGDEPAPEPKAVPPKKAPKPKPAPQKKKTANDSTQGIKRKAVAPAKKPQKRRKTVASSDEESGPALSDAPKDDELSDAESEPPKKPARRQKKVVAEDSDEGAPTAKVKAKEEETDGEHEAAPAVKDSKPKQKHTPRLEIKGGVSESELSSLIDESPVKKKRQKTSPSEKRKSKEPKASKPKTKASKSKAEDDPDVAEIKRLQGWLVKCGIRKVWGKELAKYDTAKEKAKYLKGMLKDAGMEGKYSNEKAARIKEKREFAKDLEDIQAGALAWGKTEDPASGRPRRRLNRPVQKVVVPDKDSDKEEDGQKDEADTSDESGDDEAQAGSENDEDDGDEGDDSE